MGGEQHELVVALALWRPPRRAGTKHHRHSPHPEGPALQEVVGPRCLRRPAPFQQRIVELHPGIGLSDRRCLGRLLLCGQTEAPCLSLHHLDLPLREGYRPQQAGWRRLRLYQPARQEEARLPDSASRLMGRLLRGVAILSAAELFSPFNLQGLWPFQGLCRACAGPVQSLRRVRRACERVRYFRAEVQLSSVCT